MPDKKNILILLLLLSISASVFRFSPFFLPVFQDPDHYYHLRIAEKIISEQMFPIFDELSYQGRAHTYYPLFHIEIASLALLFGISPLLSYALLPIILSIAAILSVFILSKKFSASEKTALFSSLIFTFIPATLFRTMAFSRPDSFILLTLPVLILALLSQKRFLIFIIALFLPLMHPFTAIFAACVFSLKILLDFIDSRRFDFISAIVFFIPLLLSASYYFQFPLGQISLHQTFATSSEMSSFNFSMLIFSAGLPLVFMPFALLFPKLSSFPKKHFLFLTVWAGAALLLSLWASRNLILFSVPASIIAAFGFSAAMEKVERFQPVLVGMLCAVIFLASFFYLWNFPMQYSVETVSAAKWISSNTPENASIASFWDKGHLLTEVAKRKVVMDGYFEFIPNLDERYSDVMRPLFFLSSDSVKLLALKYSANYVFVDEKIEGHVNGSSGNIFASSANSSVMEKILDNGRARIFLINTG